MRPAQDAVWRRGDWLILAALVVLSGVLRLWRLDLIEFKSDEAGICDIAIRMIDDRRMATHGLVSGTGLTNFPMFAYLLVPFVLLSREPVFVTGVVALANVCAIGMTYIGCRRRWGRGVATWAGLLMSCSPLAILFSRKIWAQNVLPVLIVPALFALLAVLDGRRSRILAVVLLAGVAAMTHPSGLCAVLACVLCGVVFRPRVCRRRAGAGVLILAVLAAPYGYYWFAEGRAQWNLLAEYLRGRGTAAEYKPTLGAIVRSELGIVADDLTVHLAEDPAAAAPRWVRVARLGSAGETMVFGAGVLMLVLLTLGVGREPGGDRGEPLIRRREAAVLLIWLVAPIVLYRAAGVRVMTHYFIVTFPAPFITMGLVLERVRRRGAGLGRPVIGGLVQAAALATGIGLSAFGIGSTVALAGQVERRGGLAGDYGVALRHKAAAVEHIRAMAANRPVELVGDFEGKTPLPGAEEYEYLLRLRGAGGVGKGEGAPGPAARFVIVDLFRYKLSEEELGSIRGYSPRRFGPLLVFEVPSDDGRFEATP